MKKNTPTSDPDISMVQALAQIRDMFPGLQIIVSIRDCGVETGRDALREWFRAKSKERRAHG